ncbi:MAG: hypothetical protein A3I89_03005 [Candidatus Harrisonbacteria bacterium RIFCSPLOWO2_02_FULL_41_11]|uniref:Peptidase S11 D-alanyl-D-alanine carboxypeptidase A N-terminal domain-containing protein n=1 Tax=Candidatus Harrisonbacteria bacterium RIFCSPHIGHO2_02_FULL_42_16 TaxID=1798404 RepID=A0A1G1ZIH0_9BACT|nr:MAG: hypothetical protein A3B92_02455 [Candidatus Harrisonbacteria bacterium RIFCSPHIGHO2_02_FULL_42_16]OGY67374.1 MAG: hypothetical protein A3I89_03005 [Candidatus Harrisonbacteria bacterium RIFCSPLOWO2_02_FULL_41_11]
MKENQLKIIFAAVMVLLAVFSKIGRDIPEKNNLQEAMRNSSFYAANNLGVTRPDVNLKKTAPHMESGTALTSQFQESIPYRKNWEISEPDLKIKAGIAKDLTTGTEFYILNPYDRWPIASLTKLMTAIIAIEEVGINKKTIISEYAVNSEGVAGNLKAGEQYSVSDLLKTMLAVSSNDAAVAIAEFYGTENFIEKMRLKASALNMFQTSFSDTTGLSFLNQSNIEDLIKLIQYIYKNHPSVFGITAQKKVRIFEESGRIEKELLNINFFASSRTDFLGGKTGFIEESGSNLISLFRHEGHDILIIVLGTNDRFGQTDLLYNWVKEAYGF